jgi:glycosyltransferase involved in cell wall biosynthesis
MLPSGQVCFPKGSMKVALVHYWLTGMRGGEKVLEVFCDLFPDADIFTLVADEERLSDTIRSHKITTSFLQRIGGVKHYKKMLPLMPFALESFDLNGYDLVISSEAGPAKGIVAPPDSVHICYCHSPMRYIWDLFPEYQRSSGRVTRSVMNVVAPFVRQWDVTTALRVDHFIANSNYVAQRIHKYYRRDATVINPPVDGSRFSIGTASDVYICAGQITPYKRIEIAIEAFNNLGLPLKIIGGGATDALRKLAGPNIEFLGRITDEEMASWFSNCRALIFPGIEDFGIIPLEVMAAGRPVIAYGRGGAAESVVDGKSGILFATQTEESLRGAVQRFEAAGVAYTPEETRTHALRFNRDRFATEIRAFVDAALSN